MAGLTWDDAVALVAFVRDRYDERERSVEEDVLPSGEAAWVLDDLECKRRILDHCESYAEDGSTSGADLAFTILPLLAAPFAAHPDYRDEWKP